MATTIFLRPIMNNKGVVLIFVAMSMIVLLGLAAFAVDAAYIYVVKSQLQNAADAGALAGAGTLQVVPTFQDALAKQNAVLFVQKNKAAGAYLTDAQVEAGYWNSNQKSEDPLTQTKTTANDVPAVKVTVSKSPDNNGGSLPLHFAKVLGYQSASITARAVAALSPAGTLTGNVLPIAIPQNFADTNLINNGQSSQVNLFPDKDLNSWWTTLKESPGANTTKDLTDPNHVLQNPISIGDQVQVSTGDKTSIYSFIDSHKGETMYVPVVNALNRIVGFLAFQIESATGGSTKSIVGYFVGPIQTQFAGRGSGGTDYHSIYSIGLAR